MPELPEAEVISRKLSSMLVGQRIKDVDLIWPKWGNLAWDKVIDKKIERILRHGKEIIWLTNGIYVIRFHMRLNGGFYVDGDPKKVLIHPYVIIKLSKNSVSFGDKRKLAVIDILPPQKIFSDKSYGPDALSEEFNTDYFKCICKKSRKKIKSLLMDQKVVMGLGNTYVDEILYHAGISPLRKANTLSNEELKVLVDVTKSLLAESIQMGGIGDYTKLWDGDKGGDFGKKIIVHEKEGSVCPRCGASISRITVDGRGTYYCPECQK